LKARCFGAAFGVTIHAGAPSFLTGVHSMKLAINLLAALALTIASQAWSAETPATPTCNSGPQSGWKSPDALKKRIAAQSITVKQVNIVGDCYAVYAVNKVNQPVNTYYHPVTLMPVGPIPN
jgi:hypothetical protein